jgi:hypothetical protein
MTLSVPVEKNSIFASDLFRIISENVSDLAIENEKLPNKILFTGTLGLEVANFIREKEWNFNGFELITENSLIDSIIFKYSTPLTQTTERYPTQFEGGSLNGQQVNGIPGQETISKIISSHANLAYTLERTVRPEKKIRLIRK